LINMVSVSKVYKPGSAPAVSDVNLHIDQGEFIFLVGPSGAGKTTLIKLIYREEMPTAAEFSFSITTPLSTRSRSCCVTGGGWAWFSKIFAS